MMNGERVAEDVKERNSEEWQLNKSSDPQNDNADKNPFDSAA
jgi:hypothetical protein